LRKKGGDKAPLPAQAEAKAGCYAPIFKMWMNPARALDAVSAAKRGEPSAKMPGKILGMPEPCRRSDRHIPTDAAFSSRGIKR
jgi:hypothetical protein